MQEPEEHATDARRLIVVKPVPGVSYYPVNLYGKEIFIDIELGKYLLCKKLIKVVKKRIKKYFKG